MTDDTNNSEQQYIINNDSYDNVVRTANSGRYKNRPLSSLLQYRLHVIQGTRRRRVLHRSNNNRMVICNNTYRSLSLLFSLLCMMTMTMMTNNRTMITTLATDTDTDTDTNTENNNSDAVKSRTTITLTNTTVVDDKNSDVESDRDDSKSNETDDEFPIKTKPFIRIDDLRSKVYMDLSNFTSLSYENNVTMLIKDVASFFGTAYEKRIQQLLQKTTTHECRMKIIQHFSYYINAIILEESLPFTDMKFRNDCNETVYDDWSTLPQNISIGDIQNRTYQPPRNVSYYIPDPKRLKILYVILCHDNVNATIRLIEALYEEGHLHQFVLHVDQKYEATQLALVQYISKRTIQDVHIVPDPYRVRVNWGGYSMVNATIQAIRYAFALDTYETTTTIPGRTKVHQPLMFHKLVHLSSSTYPIASNPEIRHTLSSYPLDANFLHVIMQPVHPNNYVWHYFVECDDSIHRIYQLQQLRRQIHNINLYTSSQWFIISRDFAHYIAVAEEGTMVNQYLRYIEHVVVADETFFGTVLRHTKFCHTHHNHNFLHLQFDRWESTMPVELRDPRKCPMPDPNHCGRSPTTMTLDYADIMELSADLFARKFDDSVDSKVKDVVDEWRAKRAYAINYEGRDPNAAFGMNHVNFEGHGVLIVAKSTVSDPVPLCLAIGTSGNKIQLLPCFESWVPPTLADQWETGAVILSETKLHTRWSVGPCTTDGEVVRLETGIMNVTLGKYSATGPRCMLQQMDGMRAGRCYDSGSTSLQPGGETQVYPCMREWYQFVSFGDGIIAPLGSLYSTIPSHIVKQIRALGHEQIPHMCLGVFDRGDKDEINWEEEKYRKLNLDGATIAPKKPTSNQTDPFTGWEPLSSFRESAILTTQCTNLGAVIEWVFVPFIEEEHSSNVTSPASEDENKNTTTVSNETGADDQEL